MKRKFKNTIIFIFIFTTTTTGRISSLITNSNLTTDVATDVVKDFVKDASTDVTKDVAKNVDTDLTKDIAKETSTDVTKDTTKDVAKNVDTGLTKNIIIDNYALAAPKPSYSIDIYFDNAAVYCYNKGIFDPSYGKYYVKQTDMLYPENGKSFSAGKLDVTTGGVWFGFDGSRNLITVVNKSTASVKCAVSSTPTTKAGNSVITIFKESNPGAVTWYQTLGLTATGGTGKNGAWRSQDFNLGGAFETKIAATAAVTARKTKPFGFNQSVVAAPVTIAAKGTIPTVQSFYYTISGAPATNLNSTTSGEQIRTITLTFTA